MDQILSMKYEEERTASCIIFTMKLKCTGQKM